MIFNYLTPNPIIIMSIFTPDNIKMGCHNEWQALVDKIKETATYPDASVIIFTNAIEHHIHYAISQLIQNTGDSFQDGAKDASIIATDINNLETAILEFQKLKIVQEMSSTRSYQGPNAPPHSSIEGYVYHDYDSSEGNSTQQITVDLSWDS